MGSEGSRALEAKLRQYVEYEATGQEQAERGVFPKTLWLAPNTERAAVIQACVERLPHSAWELFQVGCFSDAVALFAGGKPSEGLPGHEKIEATTKHRKEVK
jgi:hypothetical protein